MGELPESPSPPTPTFRNGTSPRSLRSNDSKSSYSRKESKYLSFGVPGSPLSPIGNNRTQRLNVVINGTNANHTLELLLQMSLKISDIGHVSKENAIHRKWTELITAEFFEQGDEERRRGMKVSAFMDRENVHLVKSQIGFFKFVCLPLFEVYYSTFPASKAIHDTVSSNMKYWVDKNDDQVD